LLDAWKQTLNAAHTVAKFESWPNLAVQVAADIGNVLLVKATAEPKGVAEAPLREVLKRLGETEVAEAEIPDRLAKAADELIRLHADLARLSNDRPEFAAIRARASALIGKGDFDAARAALREGQRLADEMLEELSRTKVGFLADEARVDRLQLNYDPACVKFAEAAGLDPDKVWLWIELGDLWTTRGSLAEAKKAFSASRNAASRNGNDRDLSVSHNRIGDTQVAQGDLAGALKSYRDSLAIRDRLTKSDPGNAQWQRDLSVSYEKIGNVQAAKGDLAGALKSYRDSLSIRDRLSQSDPGNSEWQRDLSVSYDKIGDVQVDQGVLAGALKSYRDSHAIADRLAKSDPDNASWRRDLSVLYERVGDVQVAQGDLAGALKSYRDSLAIRDRLTQSDPGNAGWQRDLSASYNKVGNVQVDQGDLAGALTSYRDSLAIRDRLAQSDLGNAGWQRDLAVSNGNIGVTLNTSRRPEEALAAFRRGHAIMVQLTALSPDNVTWKRHLDWLEKQIAEISQ
jgi:tetratricopeptide (TPR) repeat protein